MGAPGDLRRFLAIIMMIGCVFLLYMFWAQPTSPTSVPLQTFVPVVTSKDSNTHYAKIDFRWTWTCENKRCVRKESTETGVHVSLTTCSMLCGSSMLWPQPTGPTTLGSHSVSFDREQLTFETTATEPARSYIQYSFAMFNSNVANLIQLQKNEPSATPQRDFNKFIVKVFVEHSDIVKLTLSTDESYKLILRMEGENMIGTVTANNFFGARHGLETLSQLIWWDEFASGAGSLKIVKGASVQDAPKFAYRGLMIDTARNFLPVESLKRVLVGMAANKLNVFHWHVSDSQSFPLVLPSVPQLAKYGSYSPDMVYTASEVKDLVEYARLRGIRVVIEVDVPAHVGNGWTWGPAEGLGELVMCVNVQPWSLYCGEPPCGQINPDNPHVYDVLEKIYRDIIELTGESEIFHIGGDEVNLECWQQFRNRTNPYVDLFDVWGNFTVEALKRVTKANGGKRPKHVMIWSSNLTKRPYLTKFLNKTEVLIQAWGGSDWTETPELVSSGYNVIISHVDAWYLDCGYGRWRENGGAACDPYRPWQTVYMHRPWNGDPVYRKSVLGAEACLWTEQADHVSLDTRLWPRAAAFAERVWSDVGTKSIYKQEQLSIEDVYARIQMQRERMIKRGLKNEALWPQWCSQNPGMCL
ncbi:probable beta-hexosaminidase fdl isoform X2 [Atheta coriaria]